MKITVGTKNKIKIAALKGVIRSYGFLEDATVEGVEIKSGVADQPKNLDETISGAKNRAKNAFQNRQQALSAAKGDLGVGIEDGLMEVAGTLTGLMNVTAAAFYDGKRYYLGLSAAFEYPPEAVKLVKKGLDINQTFYKMKLTDNPKIGSARGAVAILTKGRWNRRDTIKQAFTAALIQLDNKNLYL